MFQGRMSAPPFFLFSPLRPFSLSHSVVLAGKAGLGEEAFQKGDAAPREKETNSINVVAAHCFRTCRLCFVPARKLHGRETPRAGGFSSPTFRHLLLQGDLLFAKRCIASARTGIIGNFFYEWNIYTSRGFNILASTKCKLLHTFRKF